MLFKLNFKHINILKRHKCVRRTMRVPFSRAVKLYATTAELSLIRIVVLFQLGWCVAWWSDAVWWWCCGSPDYGLKNIYLLTFLCFDNVMNTKCFFSGITVVPNNHKQEIPTQQNMMREFCMFLISYCARISDQHTDIPFELDTEQSIFLTN